MQFYVYLTWSSNQQVQLPGHAIENRIRLVWFFHISMLIWGCLFSRYWPFIHDLPLDNSCLSITTKCHQWITTCQSFAASYIRSRRDRYIHYSYPTIVQSETKSANYYRRQCSSLAKNDFLFNSNFALFHLLPCIILKKEGDK